MVPSSWQDGGPITLASDNHRFGEPGQVSTEALAFDGGDGEPESLGNWPHGVNRDGPTEQPLADLVEPGQ